MTRNRALGTALLDAACIVVAIFVVREVYLRPEGMFHLRLGGTYETLALVAAISWWGLSQWVSGGSPRWTPFRQDFLNVTIICALGGLLLSFVVFALKMTDVSRVTISAAVVLTLVLMLGTRFVRRVGVGWFQGRGDRASQVLLVADEASADRFLSRVADHPEIGVRVSGILVWSKAAEEVAPGAEAVVAALREHASDAGVPVVRPLASAEIPEATEELLADSVVDEVVVGLPIEMHELIEDITLRAARQGKPVRLLVDGFITQLSKYRATNWFGQPVLSIGDADDLDWHVKAKRVMDVVGSLILLVVLSPLLLAVAVIIKVSDPRAPVFFDQMRVGRNGRQFRCIKFRTMVPDAEARLEELRERNEMDGPAFKIRDDPRVTRIGRWLRRTSIDELPQLWNVLLGQMSLVGPRPPLPSEVVQYDAAWRKRLSVRPGLTCLWQISGRNNVDFERWMELDLEYVERWSLWLDVAILLRTIPAVLGGRGAY